MKHVLAFLFFVGFAAPLQAACYADYKAKQDSPLRLHYGVAEIPDSACSVEAAAKALEPRLSANGWTLLNVLSVFDENQRDSKKGNAGDYFLRY